MNDSDNLNTWKQTKSTVNIPNEMSQYVESRLAFVYEHLATLPQHLKDWFIRLHNIALTFLSRLEREKKEHLQEYKHL